MIFINTVNLDAEDPCDLDEFAVNLERLAAYAKTKAFAMRARLAGEINVALRYERHCELVYNLLPSQWRW
jgi:hypothetical protein